jgi:hypothetical protein
MLPLLVRTANIYPSYERHQENRNLFLITANSLLRPHKTSGYPQILRQISTNYKSLAPLSKGNSHMMCERNFAQKFGQNTHQIRCRLVLHHTHFTPQKSLSKASFRPPHAPKRPSIRHSRHVQAWNSNTSKGFGFGAQGVGLKFKVDRR